MIVDMISTIFLHKCVMPIYKSTEYRNSHISNHLFPSFLRHHYLQILYTTNFLRQNVLNHNGQQALPPSLIVIGTSNIMCAPHALYQPLMSPPEQKALFPVPVRTTTGRLGSLATSLLEEMSSDGTVSFTPLCTVPYLYPSL